MRGGDIEVRHFNFLQLKALSGSREQTNVAPVLSYSSLWMFGTISHTQLWELVELYQQNRSAYWTQKERIFIFHWFFFSFLLLALHNLTLIKNCSLLLFHQRGALRSLSQSLSLHDSHLEYQWKLCMRRLSNQGDQLVWVTAFHLSHYTR